MYYIWEGRTCADPEIERTAAPAGSSRSPAVSASYVNNTQLSKRSYCVFLKKVGGSNILALEKRPDEMMHCRFPCMNGGTCVGDSCLCRAGYQGEFCSEAICKESCLNGGRCIAPDRCACIYGYTGKRCEADKVLGIII
uniref:Uncharacterized protein n=1 Tax=Rhodnius prolixus TaxID=13249 RepID=T1HXV0_RHOPR